MADPAPARRGLLRRLVSRPPTPATIAARLVFDNVSHRYGEVEAVSGVTLDVAPGELVCLLGPSGCGKTTLLRLAAGVEHPASGRILINGQNVTGGATRLPPESRGVGLMFQDFALFPHLTNLANVMFGLRDLPRAAAEQEARRALDRVGLADLAEAYPHMLSGGEQQRIALARAVVPRPSVLLMDEPFSGLDRRLRDEVREETLSVLRESRVTCIVVTHDPEEALRMGDRIALMRGGRLVQVDEPERIYRRPVDLFAARYFCDLNELPGRVEGGAVGTVLGRFAAPGLPEGSEAIVAIRPQGVRVGAAGEGVPAWLEGRRFLGELELLELSVEGLDAPLRARMRASGDGGRTVKREAAIAVDPAEVLVFAAAGA